MKNINRDHLVVVNAKTAEIIDAPRDMSFYVTDRYTSNIFFQLTIDDTNNSFVNAPFEDASNYTLTLRVLKPNDEPKEIEAVLLNKNSNFFVADLDPEFTNFIGTCQCELFIETTIDGRLERSTTDPFEYEVIESIFSYLNEVIESDPDYPSLIDSLATKDYVHDAMENMDLYGYATRDYVNQVVIGGDVDLSDYVTDEELNRALANLPSGGDVDLSGYVTDEELAEALINFSGGGTVDLSNYITEQEFEGALSNKADSNHTHNDYATRTYVNESIAKAVIDGDIDLDNYVTDDELNSALANKANSNHTHNNYVTDQELSDALANSEYDDSELRGLIKNKADENHTHNEYATEAYVDNKVWIGTQYNYDRIGNKNPNILYFIQEDEE